MKCPNCQKEITKVNIISECWQKAELNGNKIVNCGSIEEILETVKIECPECYGDIKDVVIET
jgi:hypothetical protein